MNQSAAVARDPNPSASVALCSHDGCNSPAEFAYVWPWGTPGQCCPAHRHYVSQRASQLNRGEVHFTVLDPNKPVPFLRDERTQLRAKLITAEEDMQAAHARSAQLFQQNGELAAENRRLKARTMRLEALLKDEQTDHELTKAARDNALADAGAAQKEVSELQAMLPRGAGR